MWIRVKLPYEAASFEAMMEYLGGRVSFLEFSVFHPVKLEYSFSLAGRLLFLLIAILLSTERMVVR